MKRHIQAATSVHVPLDKVREVLRDEPGCLFGGPPPTAHDRCRRQFPAQVGAQTTAGLSVTQEVEVVLGPVEHDADQVSVSVWWLPQAHEELLPSFDGELVACESVEGRTRLVLDGDYRVPLGLLGRFGDGLVGHRIARRTITDFLIEIARNLSRAVTTQADARRYLSPAYPEDLRGAHRAGPDVD